MLIPIKYFVIKIIENIVTNVNGTYMIYNIQAFIE